MKQRASQLQCYVRHWWPSKYQVGPLQELILDKHTVTELREKVRFRVGHLLLV